MFRFGKSESDLIAKLQQYVTSCITVIPCEQAHAPEAEFLGFDAKPESKRGVQIKNLYCRSS
jgi:hypothetical protein